MSLNVLIVDDSAVMRRMISKSIRMSKIPIKELHEAATGKEGLEVLDKNWIDLVLTDLNMPEMNGEEMIEEIKKMPELADVPIIVISTEGSERRIERILKKGVSFIHKPFTPEKFNEVIISVVEGINELE